MELVKAMQAEAEHCYPNEGCGFVVGVGKKAIFMPAENVAETPNDQFVIDWRSYAAAEDAGEVLAVWHSHPSGDATASNLDRAGCEISELPWLISPIRSEEGRFVHGEINCIQPDGFEMPYIGRPYVFGTFDCYSLLRDYYRREFGIQLDGFHNLRIPQWWRTGKDLLEDNWREQGFVPVTDDSWQDGDALTFAVDSDIANHVAIYVTGDIILHHLVNRLSRRETMGPYWSRHLRHHLRHTSKC